MERGLLSDPKLAALYDKVVWLYLFQDFTGSESDRAAQRVAIRFGISSWPQHFLVDPYTLETLGSTGRSLESFTAAVDNARVSAMVLPSSLSQLDASAAALENLTDSPADIAKAVASLTLADIVVRMRALEHLIKHDEAAIVKAAPELLTTPNDQVRFAVCRVLEKLGDAKAREALELLVKETPNSKNPNVLRINAVKALGRCGNAESIEVIAPYAISGVFNNGLTGVSLDVLLALGEKYPVQKPAIAKYLKTGFPAIPEMEKTNQYYERTMRSCTALAKRINAGLEKVTGRTVAFPETYDATTRAALLKAWE